MWYSSNLLLFVLIPYLLIAFVLVVSDNRKPQSSFAWLFLFIIFPVGGMIIYVLFGRTWKAFANQHRLARQEIGTDLMHHMAPDFSRRQEILDRLSSENGRARNTRLPELSQRNSGSGIGGYNQVTLLQDAQEKYPLLLEDLKAAQHSIHLQYYIWTEDDFTRQVKEILMAKAQAGVHVRCLYDAFNFALSRRYRDDLREAGVAIHPYLRFDRLHTLHNINYRSHRKIAVIDGKIGYVGGMNLDEEQLTGPQGFSYWRDTHLRIHGEAATLLQALFANSWYNTTGEKVVDPAYFPPVRHEVDTFLPVQITSSGPDSQWRAIRQLYFHMISTAQNHVYIQSPFFIPDESIAEALKAAALSGIDVRIICQPRGSTYNIPYRAAFTYYDELAQAGCHIYLYEDGYFHAKTIAVDSAICAVGTANMDIRSFSINYETIAVLYDDQITRELERDFCADLDHCWEFSAEAYARSGYGRRFLDSVYRLASPLL